MATLTVNGTPDRTPEPALLGRGLPIGSRCAQGGGAGPGGARRGHRGVARGLQPDDIVEIELQDGLRIWSRLDDFRRSRAATARGGSPATQSTCRRS